MTADNQPSSIDEASIAWLALELDLMRPRRMGQFKAHDHEVCAGEFCCIHNPSEHSLNGAPLQLRADRAPLMERVCPHGVGHPDPDSLAYINRTWPDRGKYEDVHGCDGCCA